MRTKTWMVAVAAAMLVAAPAPAEQDFGEWTLDQNVTPVGCDSCCGGGCDCGDGCGCGCGVGGGLFSGIGGGALEGFTLAGALGIDGLDVGGWTQFGYHDSQTPLSAAFNDGAAFNDVPKNLNLQQQYFYIGKEANGARGFDWGFRADFLYGTDAQKTQSFGNTGSQFDNGAAWDHGEFGWAIPQLYGEVAMDDFSVIFGHFYTLVGFEVVTAPQNFFYSHALTMFNSEPFTHTGVLTKYEGFEGMTLFNGWTLGWDSGFDNNLGGSNYLGGFSVGLGDSVTMTYINTYGNWGTRSGGQDDAYSHSIVFDVTLRDDLQYVFQTDFVDADDVPAAVSPTGAFIENDQIGINQYLIYKYNDIVSFGSRVEWWKNGGVSNYEYTSGVNIKLLDNLILRPETRKDWVPATGFDQDMAAVDMILTY